MGSRSSINAETRSPTGYAPHNNTNEVLGARYPADNSVIGLVSIPGMMTGAILGGASISQAVKYQQIIMFLISATTTLAVTMSVVVCMIVTLDGTHRLRPDRVTGEKAWMWRIRDTVAWGIWRACRAAWYKLTCQGHLLHEEEGNVENGVDN